MNERARRILEISTLAVALLLTAAFSFYCSVLVGTVSRERAEVATRVEWLHRAQALVEQRDPGALAELRRNVAEHDKTEHLTDALAADELDDFVTAVRSELTSLSVQLAARWDALSRVAFVALALAGLATVLLWRSQHRRRSAERLRVEVAAALAEVKRAHAAAQAASEVKSDALAFVSHEFRTPLQVIISIGGLLSARALADEQRYLHASTLRSVSEGLLRLVDGLLDLSQIEQGQLSIHAKSFDLRALFVKCIEMLRGQAEEKDLRLTCELSADLPDGVIGDHWRICQVTLNLLNNAIKFTSRGSVSLRVTARRSHDLARVRVEVSDTGLGIAAQDLPRLFQPFSRLKSRDGERVAGSGLGLAISGRIIERLGGRLEVESKVGVGTTFHYELEMPVAEPPAPEPPQSDQVAMPEPPRVGIARAPLVDDRPPALGRVLVVDDDPVMRRLLTLMLERTGYSVDTVADGEAAVQRALDGYAAVLLDVDMPVLDGPAAARRIRERGGDMALLALTGHAGLTEALRCREAGIDAVLVKPVTLEDLREALVRETEARTSGVDMSMIRTIVGREDPSRGAELLEVFLREMQRDLIEILEGEARGDREAVRRGTHRLGGSAAAFGANHLARACRVLGDVARDARPMSAEHTALQEAAARARGAFEREHTRLAVAEREASEPPPRAQ